MSDIADRLIDLRGDKPRKVVADSVGISVSALAMYEQGKRIPRDKVKTKLSDYYGKTVGYIFFNKNDT